MERSLPSRLWNAFRKLHLPLYLLFFLMWGWGGFMSNLFEKYSLIDVRLAEREWGKVVEAKAHGGSYAVDPAVVTRIFRPLSDREVTRGERRSRGWDAPEYKVNLGGEEEGQTLSLLIILLWLWPLYRHHFSRRKPEALQVEKRVIGLPVLLFALVWGSALWRYFARSAEFAARYGAPSWRVKTTFAAAAVMFGAFVSYLNLELTGLYARRFIARPFFAEADPYGVRRGLSVSLTLRHALMVFSLAVFPLLLALYIPVYFNLDAVLALRQGDAMERLYRDSHVLIPCAILAVLTGFLLFFQAGSLLLFRWNVQAPLSALIERMQAVARGDFTCKTSVLYSDEIGQLKGHFNLMLDGLAERERIKDTFGKYVSSQIAEKIMKSGKVNLAGEEIQATVLFCDIRNFTPLSERLTPPELIRFLNAYFARITAPIMANHGVVNKFMGDAVMAVFSPVFGVEDHAAAALRAALGMIEALAAFNAEGGYQPVAFGVGLHTGTLIAGNVGAENRLEYTVLGDTVNVASRIESQTKPLSAAVLVSEAVLAAVDRARFPGVEFIDCGPILMKGKSRPMRLFKVRAPVVMVETDRL